MLVTGVEKCSPTNITETNIWNTQGAWTRETGSIHATYATVPSRSETDFAFTSCTCMRNTDLISAVNVASGFLSPRAWISIWECTAGRGPTNVPTASKRSQPRQSCGLTSDSTAARNRLNVVTVAKLSHRTRHMTATSDARIQRRSPAFVSSVVRRLRSHTNWNSTWTCTRARSPTPARSADEVSQALRLAIATDPTSIAPHGKIGRRRWCERVLKATKVILMSWIVMVSLKGKIWK